MREENEPMDDCLSWNCCDENLKSCIERSKYVNQIRSRLKKRTLTNNQKRYLYKTS
ncbi:MAG: hypothetical protein ACFFG0_46465 [Candidatus Thorarchaeota archaeon]